MLDSEDEKANQRIVLGGLWGILNAADSINDVVLDGEHTEALRFRLRFMQSPYRLTVERIEVGRAMADDDSTPGDLEQAVEALGKKLVQAMVETIGQQRRDGYGLGYQHGWREGAADAIQRVYRLQPPIDPDCRAGKHDACLGQAWDEEADEQVPCGCPCHQEAT